MSFNAKSKNFFLILTLAALFSFELSARDVAEVKTRTGVYRNKNGKLEKVGDIEAKEKFAVLAKTPKGNWVKINYNGKVGWVPANRVAVYAQNSRSLASVGGAGATAGTGSAQLGLIFESSSVGIGIAGGGHFKIPMDLPHGMTLDAGLIVAFFPSIGQSTSSTATSTTTSGTSLSASGFELMGQGRLFYEVQPGFDLGGDLGFVYRKIGDFSGSTTVGTVTVPTTSATSTGNSSLGLLLGGLAGYNFTPEIRAVGGLRLLVASPTTIQIHAAAEYRF